MSSTGSSTGSYASSTIVSDSSDLVPCTSCHHPIRGECGLCPSITLNKLKACLCSKNMPVKRYTTHKQCWECHMQFPICSGICGLRQDPKFTHCNYCIALINSNPELKTKLFKKKQELQQEQYCREVREAEVLVDGWQRQLSQCIDKYRRTESLLTSTSTSTSTTISTTDSDDDIDIFVIVKGRKKSPTTSLKYSNSKGDLTKLHQEVEEARKGLAAAQSWLWEIKPAVKTTVKTTVKTMVSDTVAVPRPLVRLTSKAGIKPVIEAIINTASLAEFPTFA
jgi:hypothetical protein